MMKDMIDMGIPTYLTNRIYSSTEIELLSVTKQEGSEPEVNDQ